MYDPTFHPKTLKREFIKSDFSTTAALENAELQQAHIARAVETAKSGFSGLQLLSTELRGKKIHQIIELSDKLILRRLTRNIRRLTGVKQNNRDTIIRSMRVILGEGINYRVYKLDIKNFYETISLAALLEKLKTDNAFPRDSYRLLHSFFERTKSQNIVGLPRGVAISATLAEYVMRSFDKAVSDNEAVYFYSRYVDDIFILTTGDENSEEFLKRLKENLFSGLKLNHEKTKIFDFSNDALKHKDPEAIGGVFDFLGYKFSVGLRRRDSDGKIYRKVDLDISLKKVLRIKTRILAALRQFISDRKFSDLEDRLKLLSGNYNLFDRNRRMRRNAGLYCNYRLINPENAVSLVSLDKFLRGLLLSERGKDVVAIKGALTKNQKRKLLRIGFKASFEKQVFYHFAPQRLSDLLGCWAYV